MSFHKYTCTKKAVYAVIKGLLALFHSDVDSSAWRSSPKQQAAANKLYADFCSHEMQTLALDASSLELLALAVRQQIVADRMDRPRHVPRYLQYWADFAELEYLADLAELCSGKRRLRLHAKDKKGKC